MKVPYDFTHGSLDQMTDIITRNLYRAGLIYDESREMEYEVRVIVFNSLRQWFGPLRYENQYGVKANRRRKRRR